MGIVALLPWLRLDTRHKNAVSPRDFLKTASPPTSAPPPTNLPRYISSAELATKVASDARPTTRFFVEEGKPEISVVGLEFLPLT